MFGRMLHGLDLSGFRVCVQDRSDVIALCLVIFVIFNTYLPFQDAVPCSSAVSGLMLGGLLVPCSLHPFLMTLV